MTDLTIPESDIAVKQANRLIESIYKMELNEHKLLLLATKKVNEMELLNHPFNERTKITITSAEFAEQYGITRQTAFEFIVEAKKSIYEREFDYLHVEDNGTVTLMKSRWFQARGMDVGKGEVSFMFASAVIPLIYLVKSEYTLLDLQEIGQMNSKYAVRLYKYLMRWVNAPYKNKTPIEQLRVIFGLGDDEYPRIFDFKRRVLDVAVKMVKENTGFKDLTVTSYKKGVKVVAFSFHYTKYDNQLIKNSKKQVIESSIDPDKKPDEYVIYRMTDEQITAFAPAIAAKASAGEAGFSVIGAMASTGMKAEGLAKLIESDFRKGVFTPYLGVLKILGFKPTKFNKTPPVSSTSENTAIPEANHEDSSKKSVNNPFELSDAHYELYVKKGGKLSKDQILEAAMADNVSPVKIMIADGINIKAA
jgi:plasmid replication initiation protein